MTANSQNPVGGDSIFSHLGVTPVINACGIYTDLGGSRLSPRAWAAMTEMNRSFVRLTDLLDKSGQRIATLLGAEAARVTPGAAAGIMLGAAACMARTNGARSEQLPDTTGMPDEVLIQGGHRYKYDRQVTMTGAKLVEVGTPNGTRADQLDAAITDRTAMILHPAHLDDKPGSLPLEQVAAIARRRGTPVFVDAAYMIYPTDVMGGLLQRGADLVCISAKYFGGPNAGGFVMGRRDLIDALSNVHFTRYESGKYLKFGRPLKMDRQTIVAVVVALEEWLGMNHSARLAGHARLVDLLKGRLEDVPGLTLTPMCFTMDEQFVPEPVNCLVITFDDAVAGKSAAEVAEALQAETPSIIAVREGDKLAVVMDVLEESEVLHIADRVRSVLGQSRPGVGGAHPLDVQTEKDAKSSAKA